MRALCRPRAIVRALSAVAIAATLGCGSNGPTGPTPGRPGGGGTLQPPANNQPTIESLTLRNPRPRAPVNFADVSDAIEVTAQVRDDETPVSQLELRWTATNGTFTGSGLSVAWNPDATAPTPVDVTITLNVTEKYGHPGGAQNWEHVVSRGQSIRLHHSVREAGEMSRRFLTEFSKPQTNRDWQDVMRDFSASACPNPAEVEAERSDVVNHYTNFFMHGYEIGEASVTLDFGGTCALGVRGDACIAVPVFWDSTDNRTGVRGQTRGTGRLTAAYSTTHGRWWLCSSRFQPASTFGHSFYSR